jgi:putative heme-binding domain-containing protein
MQTSLLGRAVGYLALAFGPLFGPWGVVCAGQAGSPALRPVAVWPSGPLEVMAAFDRPAGEQLPRLLAGRSIRYNSAQSVIGAQGTGSPSGALRIAAARLSDDRRTLILATDPHPCAGRYSLPPDTFDPAGPTATRGSGGLTYDLSGVEVSWSPEEAAGESDAVALWWPHLDSELVHRMTVGSRRHQELEALLRRPGKLVLSTLVNLPPGNATLRLESSGRIEEALLGDAQADAAESVAENGIYRTSLPVVSQGEPLFLSITLRTVASGPPFSLTAAYRLAPENADHPLERARLVLPWAPLASAAPPTPIPVVPDLSGGDPAAGQVIFNGERARCSQCHAVRGQGAQVGPDLSDIGKKGRAEIYRAIATPSASIEPAYVSFTVATTDGRVAAGIVRAEGADKVRITDTNAHSTVLERSHIQQIRPSATSIMPAGLAAALGETAIRDLIAFLTSPPQTSPRSTLPR